MSMRLCAALLFGSIVAVLAAAGCSNDTSKAGCNPDDCTAVKCPDGDRRACLDGACVTDPAQVCASPT